MFRRGYQTDRWKLRRTRLVSLFVGASATGIGIGCGSESLSGRPPEPRAWDEDGTADNAPEGADLMAAGVAVDSEPYSPGFTAGPVFCCDPLTIEFTIDAQTLPCPLDSVGWNFGDGRTGKGEKAQHTYTTASEYLVRATVRLCDGATSISEKLLSLKDNADGGIDVSLQPSDPPDGTLPSTGDAEVRDDSPVAPTETSGGSDDPGDGMVDDVAQSPFIVVDAGVDQMVAAGITVQLSGHAAVVPTDAPRSFRWRQLSGPLVTLFNPTSTTASFTAPVVNDTAVTLSFELAGTSGLQRDTDDVTVTVQPKPPPPPDGFRVEFLSGPGIAATPGSYTVSWRFLGEVLPSRVRLLQDCCYCDDRVSAATGPDASGVYRASVTVSDATTTWYQVVYVLGPVEYRSQSVYLRPATGSATSEPPPVIWYHDPEMNLTILADVIRPGVVTHVMLGGADREARPYYDSSIFQAMDLCRFAGVKVIWSRHLWNNYETLQTLEDLFDPAFYVQAIAQIREETAALGADLTALDSEAYANSPVDAFLDNDLSDSDYQLLSSVIAEAASVARVDYVFPAGMHGRPKTAQQLFRRLGVYGIAESTYYDIPGKNCRISYPYEVFGAYLAPTTERPLAGAAPYFLPHDLLLRRYLWSAADGAPAGVNGLFLYGGPNESTVAATAALLARHMTNP